MGPLQLMAHVLITCMTISSHVLWTQRIPTYVNFSV